MKTIRISHASKAGLQIFLLLAIISLSFGPSGTSTVYAAPPSNDNFANATTVTGVPFTDTVNSTEATTEAGEPAVLTSCDGKFLRLGTKTIWYKYTAPTSGLLSMDTTNTNYDDTYMAIWTGNAINSLTLVACDDDSEIGLTSQISATLTAGVTYYIQVAKYNGTTSGSTDPSPCAFGTPSQGTCMAVFNVRNQIFADVPPTHPYAQYIEALYTAGLTGGCGTSPLIYCPSTTMNRAQMAVFTMRGEFGSSYLPPAPSAPWIFVDDWSLAPWAENWADAMLKTGLTGGCSVSPRLYCPYDLTTKEQAAVFALRLKYGSGYNPPAATGTVFADMTNPSYWSTPWTEKAYTDGLIPACGSSGGTPLYCPSALVDRGFGAFIIAKAKGLVP